MFSTLFVGCGVNDQRFQPINHCNEIDVPTSCSNNMGCISGCYCDSQIKQCVETSYCAYDNDCSQGYLCNSKRSTCQPIKEVSAMDMVFDMGIDMDEKLYASGSGGCSISRYNEHFDALFILLMLPFALGYSFSVTNKTGDTHGKICKSN